MNQTTISQHYSIEQIGETLEWDIAVRVEAAYPFQMPFAEELAERIIEMAVVGYITPHPWIEIHLCKQCVARGCVAVVTVHPDYSVSVGTHLCGYDFYERVEGQLCGRTVNGVGTRRTFRVASLFGDFYTAGTPQLRHWVSVTHEIMQRDEHGQAVGVLLGTTTVDGRDFDGTNLLSELSIDEYVEMILIGLDHDWHGVLHTRYDHTPPKRDYMISKHLEWIRGGFKEKEQERLTRINRTC